MLQENLEIHFLAQHSNIKPEQCRKASKTLNSNHSPETWNRTYQVYRHHPCLTETRSFILTVTLTSEPNINVTINLS